MIYHGHLVHPDIWMLWLAIAMVPVNATWLVYLSVRRRQ